MKDGIMKGVCTALVTPFKDGKVNLDMLKTLLEWQMGSGIRSFVICGTTGEAPTLSEEEKCLLFREAKRFVGSEGMILAGTGSNCTKNAVKLSRMAQDQGADGLLVVTPYYNKCSEEGLLRHYAAIGEAVSIPVILYNVPSRTGVDIPVSFYEKLAKLPNIAGVKEAAGDIRKLAEIKRFCPEDFSVYTGNDDLLLPALALGAEGVISVASNVKPARMKNIIDCWQQGDVAGAREAFFNLYPLIKALFSEVNPIPVKRAMAEIGYDCGSCRLPLTDMEKEKAKNLIKLL